MNKDILMRGKTKCYWEGEKNGITDRKKELEIEKKKCYRKEKRRIFWG